MSVTVTQLVAGDVNSAANFNRGPNQLRDYINANEAAWLGPQAIGPHGSCRLKYINATSIRLDPQGGNTILVKISGAWTVRAIPSAGITIGNGGLSASTKYYVYVYDAAGTLTLELNTTGHATDVDTGVEIKSGDASRTLVGMIYTTSGSQFAKSAAQGFVLSWFSQAPQAGVNSFTQTRTTGSAALVEINTEIRVEFLAWGGADASLGVSGYVSNTTVQNIQADVYLDGVSESLCYTVATIPGNGDALPIGQYTCRRALSEGYHYLTVYGATAGGTLSFVAPCRLSVSVMG